MVHGVEMTDVAVGQASDGLRGVLGVPRGAGPWPAVVMVHEVFGVTDVMRRQVERLASAGYLVLMPDLFTGPRRCLIGTFRAMMRGEGRAFRDIDSARTMLLARTDCTGAVGVIGFCMGGGFALLAATRGFDAASSNYGMLPRDIEVALAGACPIVGSYGGKDRMLPGAKKTLEESLDRIGVPNDIEEYPGARHSFMNDEASGPRPLRLILQRVLGAGPDPVAAADSWRRIEAFFGEHLR